MLLHLAAIMALLPVGTAAAADAIVLPASEPYTIYYTTNGAAPAAPAIQNAYPTPLPSATTPSPPKPKPEESPENIQKNKELKKKLLKKYDLDNDNLTIRLDHTQHGPKGYINLMRKRLPDHVSDTTASTVSNENNHSRVNAIVQEFLTVEAALFGIKDLEELRETNYDVDERGLTSIRFQRYIDQLPLEDSSIQFFVRSTGEISSVSARVAPSPPELYEAVKKETLPETRILEIAEDTLRGVGFDVTVNPYMRQYIKTQKVAISTPPYVFWRVESYWNILIDAFSGEVVEKLSNIRR